MSLVIEDNAIQRVVVIDDDEESRQSLAYILEDMRIEPVLQTEPLPDDPIATLSALVKLGDAMLSDYRLRKKHNYSPFDGDRLVAAANKSGFPAVLCTSYTDSDVTMYRSLRRYIPALLSADDYSPDRLAFGFRRCIREREGRFDQTRQPFRSHVRVEDVEENMPYFYVVVPGWSVEQKIRIYYDDVPEHVRNRVTAGYRTHAKVNVGADEPEELFFYEWEES
jgi:hypothetical protein